MRADEQYSADYFTLAVIKKLSEAQKDGQHEFFAYLMLHLWRGVLETLPKSAHDMTAVLVLDAYFGCHGDLGKAYAEHEKLLVRTVGYAQHRSAVDRMELKIQELTTLIKTALESANAK